MKNIEKLEQLVKEARVEAEKFYTKGVNAAGTRLRAKLMEIKKLTHEARNEVTEKRNSVKEASSK